MARARNLLVSGGGYSQLMARVASGELTGKAAISKATRPPASPPMGVFLYAASWCEGRSLGGAAVAWDASGTLRGLDDVAAEGGPLVSLVASAAEYDAGVRAFGMKLIAVAALLEQLQPALIGSGLGLRLIDASARIVRWVNGGPDVGAPHWGHINALKRLQAAAAPIGGLRAATDSREHDADAWRRLARVKREARRVALGIAQDGE